MNEDKHLNRRDFLLRSLKVGAAVGVTGLLGWTFHDPEGPSGVFEDEQTVSLPDFSMPELGQMMAVVRGEDRAAGIAFHLIASAELQIAGDWREPARQTLGIGHRVPEVFDARLICALGNHRLGRFPVPLAFADNARCGAKGGSDIVSHGGILFL